MVAPSRLAAGARTPRNYSDTAAEPAELEGARSCPNPDPEGARRPQRSIFSSSNILVAGTDLHAPSSLRRCAMALTVVGRPADPQALKALLAAKLAGKAVTFKAGNDAAAGPFGTGRVTLQGDGCPELSEPNAIAAFLGKLTLAEEDRLRL